MDKISVIIPVYNCEDYIKTCLNSVLNQTYDNLEVLCIDDHSQDHSLDILRGYQKDSRVKVFTNPSKGCSMARNEGLKHATGEMITFVDADDFVAPNFLSHLSCVMKDENLDIIYGSFQRTPSVSNAEKDIPYAQSFDYSFIDYQKNPEHIISQSPNVWAKLYKRSAIKEEFIPHVVWEDVAFTTIHSLKNARVGQLMRANSYLNPFYYYRDNNQGITASIREPSESYLDVLKISRHMLSSCKQLLSNKDVSYSISELISYQLLYNLSVLYCSPSLDKKYLHQLTRVYRAAFPGFDHPSYLKTRETYTSLLTYLYSYKTGLVLNEKKEINRFLKLVQK